MTQYVPTIGLEIHAELKTRQKMFCPSPNDTDETRPNVNVCPICMAHPGTLPTINREAVKHVLKIGAALGGELADYTEFDRKNYFYPDIPKGYQISQYADPLVQWAKLEGVTITRIHLEEDTARSQHDKGNYSLVDYNRAGVPLMELVTEPDITSGEQAAAFARELQLVLQYLGIGDANMEKGEMRVEANISVAPEGERGTKVEVKNLNSFRAVEKAIAYEIERHTQVYERGEEIIQETRGWDEEKESTFSQRQKETSEDYRYFPDPDLPHLRISEIPEFSRENLEDELPEMPWERRERYAAEYGLDDEAIGVYVKSRDWGTYFEEVVAALADRDPKRIKTASNYIVSDYAGLMKQDKENVEMDPYRVAPAHFARMVDMTVDATLSSRGAKDLLALLYENDQDPEAAADEHGLKQTSDTDALAPVIDEVIAENPDVVEDYKSGNEKVLKFLVGQGMKKTQGSANPQMLEEMLVEKLDG